MNLLDHLKLQQWTLIAIVLGVSSFLAGCNTVGQGGGGVFASAAATPSGFVMPTGSGCGGEVARYRAIIGNDITIGQVNRKVAVKIYAEIDQAGGACKAGNSGRSMAMIRASRARYGYPPV